MVRHYTAADAAMCGAIAVVGLAAVLAELVTGSLEIFEWQAQATALGTFGYFINRL